MCIALPGRVTKVLDPVRRLFRVERGGRHWDVSAAIIDDELDVGDWVEVHSGFVLDKLSDEQAEDMLAFADELVAADESGVASSDGDSKSDDAHEPEERDP